MSKFKNLIKLRVLAFTALAFMAFAIHCESASAQQGGTLVTKTFNAVGFGSNADTATAQSDAKWEATLKAVALSDAWRSTLPIGSVYVDSAITLELVFITTHNGEEYWAADCTYEVTMWVPHPPVVPPVEGPGQ